MTIIIDFKFLVFFEGVGEVKQYRLKLLTINY